MNQVRAKKPKRDLGGMTDITEKKKKLSIYSRPVNNQPFLHQDRALLLLQHFPFGERPQASLPPVAASHQELTVTLHSAQLPK